MADLRTGSAIYRMSMPLGQIYKESEKILIQASTIIEDWHVRTADIIVGQRVCTDEDTKKWHTWKKDTKAKLVMELDDDLFNIDVSNINHKYYNQPNIPDNAKRNAEISDLITVTTEPLADLMRQYNDNVIVLPNYIDEKVLHYTSRPPDPDKIIVGWAGSITHEIDFAVVSGHLKNVLEKQKQVWFHMYGSLFNCGVTERMYFTGWSDDIDTYYKSLRLHIGLAPIRRCKFNESKSHIKMLEYAALGIPAIASNETPYKDFVKHGLTGYLAYNPADWKHLLLSLIKNPELREHMGYQAREYARQWTIQEHYKKWEDTYIKLVES